VRIGIDLGGTKIEGIALDGSVEVARLRVDTPRHDYQATLDTVAALVRELETRTGRHGSVGVGIPGTMSPATGLVKNANSVWLIGRPLGIDLERALGRRVRIANDANCFAVSEATDGAAAAADVVFGVIIGTGTGAGIVVNGHLLTGPNAIAGEWGHNPLPAPSDDERPGPACYCGRYGCVETFLSGPGMQADHERHTGRRLTAPDIVTAAGVGDPAAMATLERYESRMARGLAAVINILDPDVIVLGGGMSNIERLYANVPRLWTPYVFACGTARADVSASAAAMQAQHGEIICTKLVRARHGDASGVRGAAWLWPAAVQQRE
jgi:fructokinase